MSEEYISKKNVREILLNQPSRYEMLENIESAPSADVRPNIHGHWEDGNNICPKCGENKFKGLEADIYADWQPNFCPNCGADMKEPIREKGTE